MNDATLRRWSDDDLAVLERSNTPEMTEFLGGHESTEKLRARHAKYLRLNATGETHMFTVWVPWADIAVGSVGYWQTEHGGKQIYEAGWSIAIPFQGRGVASQAMQLCLDDATVQNDRRLMYAFPRVEHAASNGVCRRAGFDLRGEEDFEYPPGNPIRVNAWVADLQSRR